MNIRELLFFYNGQDKRYEVYNLDAAKEQRSPCSTFKIVSTLAALENGIISTDSSLRKWSGEIFSNSDWNKDMTVKEAFRTSCVWYYRTLINEIGQERMQSFLNQLEYGNKDISDWEGIRNESNTNPALKGFWLESCLKISPFEQVEILERIFQGETIYKSENLRALKDMMYVEQDATPIEIYGKTGYGRLNNISLDSWFVGMFELASELKYFAIHLSETEDTSVTSALAKSIAIEIIADRYQ